jgi:protein-S-isoprenylcysteine O-methyltransferase Ste14
VAFLPKMGDVDGMNKDGQKFEPKPAGDQSPPRPPRSQTTGFGRGWLVIRSVFFTIVFPGTVNIVIPYFIIAGRAGGQANPWRCLGLLPMGLGALVVFRCIRDFAIAGRGTLAPIDPPKQLVVQGLYRFVRNPMYVGTLCILLGESLLYRSPWLLLYAVGFFVAVNVFVRFYEEPVLLRQFGESYEAYRREVRRWWPTLPKMRGA